MTDLACLIMIWFVKRVQVVFQKLIICPKTTFFSIMSHFLVDPCTAECAFNMLYTENIISRSDGVRLCYRSSQTDDSKF